MFFQILLLISTLLFVYNRCKKKYSQSLPGPWTLPLLGNVHQIIEGASSNLLYAIDGFAKKYGPRFRFFIGNEMIVGFTDPKDVEVVLSSNNLLTKSVDYELLQPWLGTGLLTSSGNKWKKHRKIITPTFHFNILEHFIRIFETQSDILIQKLEKYIDGDSFNMFPYITLCALDIICESAMGVSINAQNDSKSAYVNAVRDNCRIVINRVRNPLTRIEKIFKLTKDYQKQKEHLKLLHDFTYKMINERKKILDQNKKDLSTFINNSFDDMIGRRSKLAFLDMLLLSTIDGKPLDDTSIREEVDTFLFEGHDTITSGITFLLYSISKYPEVQKKLYEEQKNIFGDNMNRSITLRDLNKMKYMELAIKESLRLYPPVAMIGRLAETDIKINDLLVTKDTAILIPIFTMNRNSIIFPEPDKFIPERFSLEECAKRNPFSAVFFSAGSRNCIGQKFAILEMKSLVSKMLHRYEFIYSGKEVSLLFDVILKSVDGIYIKIKKRTN